MTEKGKTGRPNRSGFDFATPEGRAGYARSYRDKNKAKLNEAERARYQAAKDQAPRPRPPGKTE